MELISSIIGRSHATVESIMGFADIIEVLYEHPYPNSIKCWYRKAGIEIIFIEEVADWITITNKNISTIVDFVDFMGLVDMKPKLTVKQGANHITSMIFTEVEGIKEITIHLTPTADVDTISIKAFNL